MDKISTVAVAGEELMAENEELIGDNEEYKIGVQ